MPFAHIKIAGPGLASWQVRRRQTRTAALMADILGKHASLTSVRVEQVAGYDENTLPSMMGVDRRADRHHRERS